MCPGSHSWKGRRLSQAVAVLPAGTICMARPPHCLCAWWLWRLHLHPHLFFTGHSPPKERKETLMASRPSAQWRFPWGGHKGLGEKVNIEWTSAMPGQGPPQCGGGGGQDPERAESESAEPRGGACILRVGCEVG